MPSSTTPRGCRSLSFVAAANESSQRSTRSDSLSASAPGKPYGYYPGEKSVVERMRALRAEGLGFDRLAAKLHKEGFRTRKGTAWHGFGVNRILSRLATGA